MAGLADGELLRLAIKLVAQGGSLRVWLLVTVSWCHCGISLFGVVLSSVVKDLVKLILSGILTFFSCLVTTDAQHAFC